MTALSNATPRAAPKTAPPLTRGQLISAKPREAPYKLYDTLTPGLFLLVAPTGRKSWRLRQMIGRVAREPTLGRFPDLSLEHARAMAGQLRVTAETVTFERAAEEWLEQRKPYIEEATLIADRSRLKLHILPTLGKRPVAAVKSSEIMAVMQACRDAGKADTAARCLTIMRGTLAHACVRHDLTFNPAREVEQTRLSRPPVTHRKAPTMSQLGLLMQVLTTHSVRSTARAFEFLAQTMVRTQEVRLADWSEFKHLGNPKRAIWIIPKGRMKMRRDHKVPLSRQALKLLWEQAGLTYGKSRPVFPKSGLVFPRANGKPLSENAFLSLIEKKIKKKAYTAHGIRTTASTYLNEAGQDFDVIEVALSHVERNGARRAYNRAEYLEQRRDLMQVWSDAIDTARAKFDLI